MRLSLTHWGTGPLLQRYGRSILRSRISSRVLCRFVSNKPSDDPSEEFNNTNSIPPDKKLSGLQKVDEQYKELSSGPHNVLRSAPAEFPANSGIEMLLKKDKKPYIPKLEYKREKFEYPGSPNEDDYTKYTNKVKKRKEITRWSRYIPKILTGVIVLWGMYVVKVWYLDADEDAEQNDVLSPLEFHTFMITHKQKIDDDHYLVEVEPKNSKWQYSAYPQYDRKSIWNGDKIWSVEIKQPQIMAVRAYTPLPLYFLKSSRTRSGEEDPLLKVIDNGDKNMDHGGVMLFYIKRYDDGEVSRYILSKNVGDDLEIRGPQVNYTFTYHPLKKLHTRPTFYDLPSKMQAENLLSGIKKKHNVPEFDTMDFYAAGTGIAPILQVLLSRNPYRGFVNVHYFARSDKELGALRRFIFFLEKVDRIKFIEHIDTMSTSHLSEKDVPKPRMRHYVSQKLQETLSQKHDVQPSVKEQKLQSYDNLKKRLAILEGQDLAKPTEVAGARKKREHGPYYENALAQAMITSEEKKPEASLALVCGPDGFVDYIAGGKALVTAEQGPVKGLLGGKGWDNTNVFKL